MIHRFFLLATAIVMALMLSVPQPAEAYVAGGSAAQANIAAQAEISDVTEVRRRHRHRHRHHHNWLWAAPFVAAPFLLAPRCDRYWSNRYGRWIERCW